MWTHVPAQALSERTRNAAAAHMPTRDRVAEQLDQSGFETAKHYTKPRSMPFVYRMYSRDGTALIEKI